MIYDTKSTLKAELLLRLPARFRYYYYYRLLGSLDFPEIIHIEATNHCNASCFMCPRDKLTRSRGIMNVGLFKRIIDECALYKNMVKEIHLNGFGEALLDESLCEKVEYAKRAGIKKVYFVTNGSLMSEELSENLIKAGLDGIKFSIYANSEDTYKKIHGALNFDEVEHNIKFFIQLRKQLKKTNPYIIIQMLVMDINRAEKEAYEEKWKSFIDPTLNDRINYFQVHNWGDGRNFNSLRDRDPAKLKTCTLPFFTTQILWNGDISACCYDFNGRVILGSLTDSTIKYIWNGPSYKRLRDIHRKRIFGENKYCLNCDQLVFEG